jgi:hypothetical protein
MVEEGTTNLFGANGSILGTVGAVPTGMGCASGGTLPAVSTDISDLTGNGKVAKHTRTPSATADANVGYFSIPSQASGTTITVNLSVWIPATSTLSSLSINLEGAAFPSAVIVQGDPNKKGQWQALTATGVTGATGASAAVLRVNCASDGQIVYSDAWQGELKAYRTSWTDSTRTAETLTIPTTGLSPSAGTVEMWVYVSATTRRLNAGYNRIFELPRAGNNAGILLFHDQPVANWKVECWDDTGNASSMVAADSYTPDGWHHFAVRWNAAEASLFIDGVKRGFANTPRLPSAFYSPGWLGSSRTGANQLNTYFDDIHISTVARSDAEIAAHAGATAPIAADGNTLGRLPLDGSLVSDYPSSATIVTKSIDVGKCNTSSIGYRLTQSLPAGTSITVSRWRDSADNSTWSAWQNTVGSRTSGPTRQYVQFEVTLATTNAANTPTLSLMTLLQPGGDWIQFYLGEFLLISPERSDDESGTVTREVEAYDQTIILRDDKVDGKFLIVSGTRYDVALTSILQNAGITRINITPSTKTLPADREWEGGTSKLAIVNDLLEALNYNSIWFDENGYAVCSPYVLPANAPVEYAYADTDDSVIMRPVKQSCDVYSIPNKWVFVVSDPDRPALRSSYVNDNVNSKLSTVNRGLTKVDYRAVDAADQATLDSLVQRAATDAMSIFETVVWQSWPMPFHSFQTMYSFAYTNSSQLKVSGNYREQEWSFDLKEDAVMNHSARKTVVLA